MFSNCLFAEVVTRKYVCSEEFKSKGELLVENENSASSEVIGLTADSIVRRSTVLIN